MWSTCRTIILLALAAKLASALDAYCGKDYFDAVASCVFECNGDDSECIEFGPDYSCFMYTGCTDKVANNGTAAVGESINSPIFDADTAIDDINATALSDDELNGTDLSNEPITIEPTLLPVKTK